VLLETSMGDMVVRLSDSTPLHRDNFLKLVKMGYYDGILFHRVINHFMIQAGDPESKNADMVKCWAMAVLLILFLRSSSQNYFTKRSHCCCTR
jgi:cyclophilin family peptidyl-prolyl cis-trans isomerase